MVYLKSLKITFLLGILLSSTLACNELASADKNSGTVHIKKTDNGYELIRNQKPFYIKGAAGNSHLKELKEAGGNTVRLYDTINLKKNLDAAHEQGLAVIVDIPLPKYGDGSHFYEQDLNPAKEKITAVVSKHKDHPALLYWNLGNELYYPTFHKPIPFFDSFNSLIDLVKQTDPNHPVSTAIIGGNRRRLASVAIKSPGLDFVSINSFGNLTDLKKRMEPIALLWDGPYVITEWGVNGPWEEDETSWGAPIEHTSSSKAQILKDRFNSEIMQDPSSLGSVVFFWGNKQERTNTWFSIFSEAGHKSESFHTLRNLWTQQDSMYKGPRVKYALLNEKGAPTNIILSSGEKSSAEVFLHNTGKIPYRFDWKVRKEAWAQIEEEQPVIENLILEDSGKKVTFKAPVKEGPYRLFVYVIDGDNNFSTTNIPFYVLNPADGE